MTKKFTLSVHPGKQCVGNSMHNNRTQPSAKQIDSIDRDRSADNIYLIDHNEETLFNEYFGESLASFNQKNIEQRHPDRVRDINSLISNNIYELIVTIGNRETASWLTLSDELKDRFLNTFIDYADDFVARYTGKLIVSQACIHLDESTAHMHLRYFGVARNQTRGMHTQPSRKKVLTELFPGNDFKHDNPTSRFSAYERERFAEIALKYELEREIVNKTSNESLDKERFVKLQQNKELDLQIAQKQNALDEILQEEKLSEARKQKIIESESAFRERILTETKENLNQLLIDCFHAKGFSIDQVNEDNRVVQNMLFYAYEKCAKELGLEIKRSPQTSPERKRKKDLER